MTRRSAAIVSSLILLLASCATGQASSQPVRVLAVETWLADIAQNVAGSRVHVDSLLRRGADPDEYLPAPLDTLKIARSQVLIVNGLDYESWLQPVLQDAGGRRVLVTASDGLIAGAATPTPEPDDVLSLFPLLQAGTPVAAGPAIDPHAWMDPANVIRYVNNIRDGLTQADPVGRELYAANAAAYIDRLRALDASIRSQVARVPPEKRLLVTNHDSLGVFARAYGFRVVGSIMPGETGELPTPEQTASLVESMKQAGAAVVLVEAGDDPALAEQVAASTHARIVNGLYVETLSAADGPAATYIDMLEYDVGRIVKMLK